MAATNKGYEKEIDALLEGGAQVNITHKVSNSIIIPNILMSVSFTGDRMDCNILCR